MDDNILRYTLRVNRTLFQKFRYIADYEGRSANREIEQYIKQRVKAFEEKHGEIEVNFCLTILYCCVNLKIAYKECVRDKLVDRTATCQKVRC